MKLKEAQVGVRVQRIQTDASNRPNTRGVIMGVRGETTKTRSHKTHTCHYALVKWDGRAVIAGVILNQLTREIPANLKFDKFEFVLAGNNLSNLDYDRTLYGKWTIMPELPNRGMICLSICDPLGRWWSIPTDLTDKLDPDGHYPRFDPQEIDRAIEWAKRGIDSIEHTEAPF